MKKRLLKSLLNLRHRSVRSSLNGGFTLLELLVVSAIAGLIISGLMFLVVQLLGVDQVESSRNETQRDMQNALDFIAAELREAVYVYPGRCLEQGTVTPSNDQECPGLVNYLPDALSTNSIPVLAFWKPQPFPTEIQNQCRDSAPANPPPNSPPPAALTIGGRIVPCALGQSYALVVYSYSTANPTNTWQGGARITRYMLQEFAGGGRTVGYVNPANFQSNFATWPFYVPPGGGATFQNFQPQAIALGGGNGRPTGNPVTLVDFVDDGTRRPEETAAASNLISCPNDTRPPATTPPAFTRSPSNAAAASIAGYNTTRSFYACVSTNGQNSLGEYQEVILFLRGNSRGRSGVATNQFLPTLETRVLARGVLQRTPPQ